jgi:hypothetical protein
LLLPAAVTLTGMDRPEPQEPGVIETTVWYPMRELERPHKKPCT